MRRTGDGGERRCRLLSSVLLLAVMGVGGAAGDEATILRASDHERVERALLALNLTPADLAFKKDVGEPLWALQRVRRLMEHPLGVAAWGDEVTAAAAGPRAALLTAIGEWLETPPVMPAARQVAAWSCDDDRLAPAFAAALTAVVAELQVAQTLVAQATTNSAAGERGYAAAAFFSGLFLVDDHPDLRPLLVGAGMSETVIDSALADGEALDGSPAATRGLAVATALGVRELLVAAERLAAALDGLALAARATSMWSASPIHLETPAGAVIVGTPGADVYTSAAVLIVDPAGDDGYYGAAGVANGLLGHPVAVILDVSGDDRYRATDLLAPGSALFGLALLRDEAGQDVHDAAFVGGAGAVYGLAWVEDRAGDDVYRAHAFAQGAALVGVGVLWDGAGRDRYDLGFCGQGYAGMRAVGLLIDREGNDGYAAGGRRTDYDRNLGRHLSLAQGASFGMRPVAGGGLGALVDLAGNDHYVADVYGQGVGYWYAAGMLLDRVGEDSYHLFQYGQGSGIHLSLGLLADGGGRDVYTGFILCQGSAHDYAVGMLVDRDGDDMYTGDHHVQGRALNNAFALLLDGSGDDAYFARQPELAQGAGDAGADREYGSLSLLLDGGGRDRYSVNVADGQSLERPDYGMVQDE